MPLHKTRPFNEYSRCLEIVKFNFSEISRRFNEIKQNINDNNINKQQSIALKSLIKSLLRCKSFLMKRYKNVENLYEYYTLEEKLLIDEYPNLEKKLTKLTDDITAYYQSMEKMFANNLSLDI